MKEVSIVIVNYNVRHFLEKCLDSIYASDLNQINLDIWVVDNNSMDGSVDFIKLNYPAVKLIANASNVGFSKANNQALKQIKSPYVLILNPDTLVQNDTIRICVEKMEADRGIGAIGVKMIDGNGRYLQESKRGKPNLWNTFCKFSKLYALFPNSTLFNGYYAGHLSSDSEGNIDVLCGAFIFTRKEVLDKVGLFDEDFFMYGEDIDLSVRMLNSGYRILYTPQTQIVHFKGESTRKLSFNYIKSFYSAMSIYFAKHYTGFGAVLYAFIVKCIIYTMALFAWTKNLVFMMFRPILDISIGYVTINFVKNSYAKFKFQNETYYKDSLFEYNSIFYYLVLIVCVWFFGFYEKNGKIKHALVGLLVGTVILLSVYALLPLDFRSSRALLLLSVALALPILLTTRIILKQLAELVFGESKNKIVVVAREQNTPAILAMLDASKRKEDVVGIIYPGTERHEGSFYLNTLQNLNSIIAQFNIGEVIFSFKDMSMKEIMNEMIAQDRRVNYFISGYDNQAGIVGSSDSRKSGTIFHLESDYRLSKSHHLRIKRFEDIVGSVSLIILKFLSLGSMKKVDIKCMLLVFWGQKTLVGYSSEKSFNLPDLKPCVYSIQSTDLSKQDQLIMNPLDANKWYAIHYNPIFDVKLISRRLFQSA